MIASWPNPVLHSFSYGRVRAAFTGRDGGVSLAPYETANLAEHVGDTPISVRGNREMTARALGISADWAFARQIHGNRVLGANVGDCGEGDAILIGAGDPPASIFTADCIPILMVGGRRETACAVHAGWRGIDAGVIEASGMALAESGDSPAMAVLGPSIGICCYEVGTELAERFSERFGDKVVREVDGSLRLDLKAAAASILSENWPEIEINALGPCTHSAELFSYRGDGPVTGRQALIAWIA